MSKETTTKGGAPGKSPGTKRKLTRSEKKQIAAIIRQAKGDGKAHTAQHREYLIWRIFAKEKRCN